MRIVSLVQIENRTPGWLAEASLVRSLEHWGRGGRRLRKEVLLGATKGGQGMDQHPIFFVVFGTSIGLCKFCAIDFKLLKYCSIALNIHGLWLSSIAFYWLFKGVNRRLGFALPYRCELWSVYEKSRGFPLVGVHSSWSIYVVGWRIITTVDGRWWRWWTMSALSEVHGKSGENGTT